jgi:hypothetical protein
VLAVLVGAGSLAVHYAIRTPTSPYQVEFSTSGTACSDDSEDSEDSELILDQDTGEVLYCSFLPPISFSDGPRARGVFSADEVGRVTDGTEARLVDPSIEAIPLGTAPASPN